MTLSVINKFGDNTGNLAELLAYNGKHGVRLVRPGVSKMDIEFVGYTNGKSVYSTQNEGERAPDIVYNGTEGTLDHCVSWMKERGFDLRGEF